MVITDVLNNPELMEPIKAIPWGPILAAASAALSGGINLWSSNKAGQNSADSNTQAENAMNNQLSKNEAWYNQKMGENYLDSAEAQAAITKAQELAQEQMAAARGAQAVMGGTGATVAAAQQNANKMISDTVSGMAATATARKDAAEQTYMNRNNELTRQLIDMYGQKAKNSAAAGSNALAALGQVGSALITAFGGASK